MVLTSLTTLWQLNRPWLLFDGSTPASKQPHMDTVPSAPKTPTYQVSTSDLPDSKVQE